MRGFSVEDINLLWREKDRFFPTDSQEAFVKGVVAMLSKYQENWIVEENGTPICFVSAYFDGWTYEPHVEFFSYVTPRTKLEAGIWYFKEVNNSVLVGSCIVKCLKDSTSWFNKLCKYGVLNYVGCVPKGDYRGDQYVYEISGSKTSL